MQSARFRIPPINKAIHPSMYLVFIIHLLSRVGFHGLVWMSSVLQENMDKFRQSVLTALNKLFPDQFRNRNVMSEPFLKLV